MVRHLVVHAGFHKTGTTTIQTTLAAHRDTLHPHPQIVLRADMGGLCQAARAWSVSRADVDLGLVAYEAAHLAESWSRDTVLLSSEDLSGHMPGRHGLTDYGAAPALAGAMCDTWRQAFRDVRITWVCYTRAAAPWLASCHVQHLRAARMTLDAVEYAAAFAGSADLAGIVERVRRRAVGADVRSVKLEDHRDNLLAPLLETAGLPVSARARITPVAPANRSPGPDKIAAMLDLNRSDIPDSAWRAAQDALHRQGR